MKKIIAWSLVTLVVGVLVALGTRRLAQHRNAKVLAIRSPRGVAEAQFVRLGGVRQWVQIRGEDIDNPVILVLHGGPGFSYVPLTPFFRRWERQFTVVQWDRRGVGKTFGANGSTDGDQLTFERMAEDGLELAQWLRQRLHKQKIILVGHSVGSVVGVLMARKQPDLFYAYVGTDQIVDMARNEQRSYEMLADRARETNDMKLLAAVEKVGPPPYTASARWFEKQRLISSSDPLAPAFESGLFKVVSTAPEYGIRDMWSWGGGLRYSAARLLHEMMTLDLRALGSNFDIPVILIEGEDDRIDPTALAVEWFQSIQASDKQLVVVKGVGHNTILARSDEFLRILLDRVRPLAVATPGGG